MAQLRKHTQQSTRIVCSIEENRGSPRCWKFLESARPIQHLCRLLKPVRIEANRFKRCFCQQQRFLFKGGRFRNGDPLNWCFCRRFIKFGSSGIFCFEFDGCPCLSIVYIANNHRLPWTGNSGFFRGNLSQRITENIPMLEAERGQDADVRLKNSCCIKTPTKSCFDDEDVDVVSLCTKACNKKRDFKESQCFIQN